MRWTLLLALLLAGPAWSQTPGQVIVALEGGSGFPVRPGAAPHTFAAGDSLVFAATETAGGRLLVHYQADAGTYRVDAAAFGIEPDDPFDVEVTTATYSQGRYTHGAVNVRSGPGTDHRVVHRLARNDYIYTLHCEGGWCRIHEPGWDRDERHFVSESLLHKDAAPVRTYAAPARSSSRSVAVQCHGTTQKGARCRRRTTNASGYCYQHGR